MSGVKPVAKRRVSFTLESKRADRQNPRLWALARKSTALALLGSVLAFTHPIAVGHLDAAHLLGLDGPGADRWQTFLTASPAGSIHEATLHLDDARGSQLANSGLGRRDAQGVSFAALAPLSAADDLITGSLPDARLPSDIDPLVARDARAGRLDTPAANAAFAARRAPISLYEQHPFARLELASLPTDGFGGYVGMVPPEPAIIVAQPGTPLDAPVAGQTVSTGDTPSPYAMAMIDPSAAASPLADTQGQQQISAFLGNDRQFQCLAEGVYFEARGEPRRGQVAVAQVIMNRVNHDEFPDTICGVVYQNQHWRNRCQFSFACDGVPERITEPAAWSMAQDVSRQVLEGRDLIETIEDSTHYHATYVRPRWAPRMIRLDRVGLHIFYKGRYGGWR